MQQSTWVAPEFQELNLSSEIGSYFEEEGTSLFVDSGLEVPPQPSLLEQRRLPRRRVALRVSACE